VTAAIDPATLSEPDLIQRAQAGDAAVLAYIYDQNHKKIYRYVLARIGRPEDAEDLTAEVFLKMLDKLATFNWRGITLSAWLFRIAHNLMVDHLRRGNSPARQTAALEADILDAASDVGAEVEKSLALEEVAGAVQRLTPAQREVIQLRFAAGLSVAETARTLGKNEGTVKVLQYNAIAALRRMMLINKAAAGSKSGK
jgi:RNA polymerase sigma-70 factor (ECF subfamily)